MEGTTLKTLYSQTHPQTPVTARIRSLGRYVRDPDVDRIVETVPSMRDAIDVILEDDDYQTKCFLHTSLKPLVTTGYLHPGCEIEILSSAAILDPASPEEKVIVVISSLTRKTWASPPMTTEALIQHYRLSDAPKQLVPPFNTVAAGIPADQGVPGAAAAFHGCYHARGTPLISRRHHYLPFWADDVMSEVPSWKRLSKTVPVLSFPADLDPSQQEWHHVYGRMLLRGLQAGILPFPGVRTALSVKRWSREPPASTIAVEPEEEDLPGEQGRYHRVVVGRIICVGKLRHYAKADTSHSMPFQFTVVLCDHTGTAEVVVWNKCAAELHPCMRSLPPGTLIMLQGFRVKTNHKFYSEISINEGEGNVCVVSEAMLQSLPADRLAPVRASLQRFFPFPRFRMSTCRQLPSLSSGEAVNIVGKVVRVGPVYRAPLEEVDHDTPQHRARGTATPPPSLNPFTSSSSRLAIDFPVSHSQPPTSMSPALAPLRDVLEDAGLRRSEDVATEREVLLRAERPQELHRWIWINDGTGDDLIAVKLSPNSRMNRFLRIREGRAAMITNVVVYKDPAASGCMYLESTENSDLLLGRTLSAMARWMPEIESLVDLQMESQEREEGSSPAPSQVAAIPGVSLWRSSLSHPMTLNAYWVLFGASKQAREMLSRGRHASVEASIWSSLATATIQPRMTPLRHVPFYTRWLSLLECRSIAVRCHLGGFFQKLPESSGVAPSDTIAKALSSWSAMAKLALVAVTGGGSESADEGAPPAPAMSTPPRQAKPKEPLSSGGRYRARRHMPVNKETAAVAAGSVEGEEEDILRASQQIGSHRRLTRAARRILQPRDEEEEAAEAAKQSSKPKGKGNKRTKGAGAKGKRSGKRQRKVPGQGAPAGFMSEGMQQELESLIETLQRCIELHPQPSMGLGIALLYPPSAANATTIQPPSRRIGGDETKDSETPQRAAPPRTRQSARRGRSASRKRSAGRASAPSRSQPQATSSANASSAFVKYMEDNIGVWQSSCVLAESHDAVASPLNAFTGPQRDAQEDAARDASPPISLTSRAADALGLTALRLLLDRRRDATGQSMQMKLTQAVLISALAVQQERSAAAPDLASDDAVAILATSMCAQLLVLPVALLARLLSLLPTPVLQAVASVDRSIPNTEDRFHERLLAPAPFLAALAGYFASMAMATGLSLSRTSWNTVLPNDNAEEHPVTFGIAAVLEGIFDLPPNSV